MAGGMLGINNNGLLSVIGVGKVNKKLQAAGI